MRVKRRALSKATYAILLLRKDDLVVVFVVLFDGFNFICYKDVVKVLDYELFRSVFRQCVADGVFREIKGVFCQRFQDEFLALTHVSQSVEARDFNLVGYGDKIYSLLRSSVLGVAFPNAFTLDVDGFITTCERLSYGRYLMVSGRDAVLMSDDMEIE